MEPREIDDIVEPQKCTGCGACRNICPSGAIRMQIGGEGFLAPVIEPSLCSRCGLCRQRCPQRNSPRLSRFSEPEAYACWNLDHGERARSSSGGMFSVYARCVLEHGGTVFGAGFDERLKVLFRSVHSDEELEQLRCSKYVQADTHTVYLQVKEELTAARSVLFVGTPCQVDGLYGFLNDDPDNLYTCDFLCHGVPSPLFYRKWLSFLEKKYSSPLCSINMRSKLCETSFMGIELRFSSQPSDPKFFAWHGKGIEYLGRAFLKNYSLRKSCYQCPYIKYPRKGDVTLADFWKLGDLGANEPEKREGVSLNLVNSVKGRQMVEAASGRARYVSRPLIEAVAGNSTLRKNTLQPDKRDAFVHDSVVYDYETLIGKYKRDLFGTRFARLKAAVKKGLRRLLKGR